MQARPLNSRSMKNLIALGVCLFLVSCASTSAGRGHNASAQAQFERLKTLEGEWITVAEDGAAEAGLTIRYHVASAGNTLVETMFPGTDEEMVTVYHKDGTDLVLTHFCAVGNQPQMRAQPGESPDEIRFRFTGGANVDPDKSLYMSSLDVRFVDSAHTVATWTHKQPGQEPLPLRFSLVRSWR
mgnify:FL=1